MEIQELQVQINDINRKLDTLIEYVHEQKLRSQVVEDLIADVSIISKEVYKSAVVELEHQGIEIDMDEFKILMFKFLKNVGNINNMFGMFESAIDFAKDVSPIVKELGIDTIHKLHELEQKGYFDFFRELMKVGDNVITHFSKDDVKDLADNVVPMLETIKSITQPDMLVAINNAVSVFKSIDFENVEEVSMWRAFRELQSPEMKRGLGFMLTFLKNLSSVNNKK